MNSFANNGSMVNTPNSFEYNPNDNYNENVRINGQIVDNISSFEWEYHMRREMQEIISGVYLGPYASALKAKKDALQSCGITHIICVRQEIESHWIRPNFADTYVYLTLDIADTPTQSIIHYFSAVREFIDECLAKGGKVLVHGNAGISRSAALVIAYVMEKHSLSFVDAIRLVQRKRFCIFPNEGFRRQLIEYEPILRAKECPPSSYGGVKRPYGDDDQEDDSIQQMDTLI